jgi:16S rRNA (cytidine1402-2'-O)-methyltransferase
VIYESAVRIQKTIRDIVNSMGNRYIVISRELTKLYEEFLRGTAEDILAVLENRTLKGEVVLLIAGTEFKPIEE